MLTTRITSLLDSATGHRTLIAICASLTLLAGCSGGSDSDNKCTSSIVNSDCSNGAEPTTTIQSGQFVDSAVANIFYRTETQQGYTDANGFYDYIRGEMVTFSIGTITLPPVRARGLVMPRDMVASGDENHPVVVRIAQLLLTLDSDGDPDNGIQILDVSHNAADGTMVDFTSETFATDVESFVLNSGAPKTVLIDPAAAVSHMRSIISQIGLDLAPGSGGGSDFDNSGDGSDSDLDLDVGGGDDSGDDSGGDSGDGSGDDGGSGDGPVDQTKVDTDGDGVVDLLDKFPNDPNETKDSDGDLVGDNADAFPNDPEETKDSDGDKVGDNADAFPNDPTETLDSDGDGAGDNVDLDPYNGSIGADTDRDGVADKDDVFPDDPSEQVDVDNDGVGDNEDKPKADAGLDRPQDGEPVIGFNETIVLDGSGSTLNTSNNVATGEVLSYQWAAVSAPAGVELPTLIDSSESVTASFVTPAENGAYVFSLRVNDGTFDSDLDTVTIEVEDEAGNIQPIAVATAKQFQNNTDPLAVDVMTIVDLDGSSSSDGNENEVLTYLWTYRVVDEECIQVGTNTSLGFTDAEAAVITETSTAAQPKFHTGDTVCGDIEITLVVDDGRTEENSASEPVTVTIEIIKSLPKSEAMMGAGLLLLMMLGWRKRKLNLDRQSV